ncbi:FecR domain-containing protein [Corallococcus sp. EGB]|uniref:FecR domain-containing protein n=1 Tax=Corallococcus sp. EGB TaxID=1521117 RepID=UPI001CBAFC12|nr:FecR domain-containing protein [Corallococcus sp. EGB]
MAGHETGSLWALAAGALDAAGKARVEAHVAECAACAAEWKRVVEARALLHTARTVEPSVRWEETGAKLKAAAAKRMAVPERRFLSPWTLTLAGACVVALVVWLGGGLWRNSATQAPEPMVASAAVSPSKEDAARPAPGPEGQEQVRTWTEASATTEAERVTGAVLREATGQERALAAGMRLRSGMAVRTPPKASAVLRLPDESRVRLSADSDVVFARAESNAVHLTVQQGRLSVRASHAKRDAFLVESAGLRVSVVGTVFSVERTAAGAAVAVLEGRVRVDADGQPPRFVDAGERVELAGTGGAMKPRALSAGDRQAFRDLRDAEPGAAVASLEPAKKSPSRPDVANPPDARTPAPEEAAAAPSQAVVQAAPDAPAPEAPRQEIVTAANPLESPSTEIPQPVDVSPRELTPADDFVPYPGSSASSLASSAPMPAVQAPSMAPAPPTEPPKRKTLGALVPGGLLSEDSDERFLGYAKVQTSAGTCGRFLVGLGEIASGSPRTSHREQARILRARCFNKQRLPADAEDEFRQYLREFPHGHYASEAHIALGRSAEPEPGAPPKAPEPLPAPAPVTPRWNGSPQRVPVSPGVPRRW